MYTVYTILQRYMYNWYVALVLYWYAYSHSTNTYTCIYIIMYIYIYIKSYIYIYTHTHTFYTFTSAGDFSISHEKNRKHLTIRSPWLTWANAWSWNAPSRAPPCTTCSLATVDGEQKCCSSWRNAVIVGEIQWDFKHFFVFCFQIGISICQNLGTWCFAHKNLPIQQMRKFTSGISDKQWEAHSEACPTENSHISLTIFEKSPCESEREGVWKGYHLVMTNVAMERSTIFNR